MRFWDASALISLVVWELPSPECMRVYRSDPQIMIWTLSQVEIASALCRLYRDQAITDKNRQDAERRLAELMDRAFQVTAVEAVKKRAMRLLRVHPLKAADALQLSAALIATGEDVQRMPFMCFDQRLSQAALLEGFEVNPA